MSRLRRRRGALLSCGVAVAVVAVAAGGCSGGSSPTADPCEAMTPPAPPGTMHLCLGGALDGTLSQVEAAPTQCSALDPGHFVGTFYAPLNGVATRWDFADDKGVGTFDLDVDSAAITLTIAQPSSERSWSSVNARGRSGTITIYPDRSGAVSVTLPERNYDSGDDVPGALALTVKGTFRCPSEVS